MSIMVGVILFPDEMGISPDNQELTVFSSFPKPRMTIRDKGRGVDRQHCCARLLSPISVGFLGLVVAIVLWGTAYKLSLYHPYPSPSSRTQVAKLWLETRTSQFISLREFKGKLSHRMDLHALAAPNRPFAGLSGVPGYPDAQPEQQPLTVALRIPSRSPPFQLCLE